MLTKTILGALTATTALTLPELAAAKPVTITTTVANYYGEKAYMAIYLTDANGNYVQTLRLAAGKSRWWPSLQAWYGATQGAQSEIAGVTGASVGSGTILNFTVEIEDALIDAGYQIRVDAAVEHMAQSPVDIAVPLTSDGVNTPLSGRYYVSSLNYSF